MTQLQLIVCTERGGDNKVSFREIYQLVAFSGQLPVNRGPNAICVDRIDYFRGNSVS